MFRVDKRVLVSKLLRLTAYMRTPTKYAQVLGSEVLTAPWLKAADSVIAKPIYCVLRTFSFYFAFAKYLLYF
jgi:hypothetical protein